MKKRRGLQKNISIQLIQFDSRLHFVFQKFTTIYTIVHNSVDKALAISKEASEKGQPCLAELSEDVRRLSEESLQPLRENIDTWS